MADVELTEILGEKIEMPDRCDLQRLYNRVKELPLQGSKVGTYGFSNWLKKYLLWGFQVVDLKEYVQFQIIRENVLNDAFYKYCIGGIKEKRSSD